MAKKKARKRTRALPAAALAQKFQVEDLDMINTIATNRVQRRASLIKALNNDWLALDVGSIERVDNTNRHGWDMTTLA